ncbi:MAG: ANTAR domain-containing protein [Oscillospiraceae bacterium]|nr:ANTAR domain-containing protein [Oscillospiraceae bacterium]
MNSVLIISGNNKDREMLCELCRNLSFSDITTVKSGNEAREKLSDNIYELVIINTPLPEEPGSELAISLSESSCSGVLMLVKNELADDTFSKVEDYGVFVLQKPISRNLFSQSIRLISASCKRFQGLKQKTARLETKIDDMKLIDRAKCALIRYLSMTEPQAHRYIEKQAMDMRLSKRAIAESILNTYEYQV